MKFQTHFLAIENNALIETLSYAQKNSNQLIRARNFEKVNVINAINAIQM